MFHKMQLGTKDILLSSDKGKTDELIFKTFLSIVNASFK